jgi:predicted O-linked N-acetylglucosamine transferase (SPINDLY family)
MRRRIVAAFDKFTDVTHLPDANVARLAREAEIDIAVDLTGYTRAGRPGIFAHRTAPIQVSYLGFSATTGSDHMDYILADEVLIPETSRAFYSEKVVYLPGSYLPNDDSRRISERVFARSDLGLPEAGIVFCCFNSSYKITPDLFDVWMRILRQVPGSVLWLRGAGATMTTNLGREAERRGIGADRVVFADRLPMEEHLARHRAADLFLDTLPYNAHATAADALWAGLPVLTCAGEAYAGRVAASLLTALGLPELIVSDWDAYEALAVALAGDPARLGALRSKLHQNRGAGAVFDTGLLTHHLEQAYTLMAERRSQGLGPDHLRVE